MIMQIIEIISLTEFEQTLIYIGSGSLHVVLASAVHILKLERYRED
jgi:hypothetical protein